MDEIVMGLMRFDDHYFPWSKEANQAKALGKEPFIEALADKLQLYLLDRLQVSNDLNDGA